MQDGIDYEFIRMVFEGRVKKGIRSSFNPLKGYMFETDKDGIDWYFYKGRKLTKEEFYKVNIHSK